MKGLSAFLCIALFFCTSCADTQSLEDSSTDQILHRLQELTNLKTRAEIDDDLPTFLSFYQANAISMAEYQPTLDGTAEIEAFYREIFHRQDVVSYQKEIEEVFELDSIVLEIGTFKKDFRSAVGDTLTNQSGKYWHVWELLPSGDMKLQGEAFGFFHPVDDPTSLSVHFEKTEWDQVRTGARPGRDFPFELRAYNALMERGVRERDGAFRAQFFTDDGRFMPFAEPTLNGMNEIKPYLIGYSSRGEVNIDSISCFTYDYRYFDDFVLEYAMFRVRWTSNSYKGRTEGKGIRLWKRMEDNSLRLHREIGTHNL